MKRIFLTILLGIGMPHLWAQSESPIFQEVSLHIGQFPASLAVPRFSAIHPGLGVSAWKYWGQNPKHRMVQELTLNYFYHRNLQHAIQIYTEGGYRFQLDNGLQFTPLMIGGGYVMGISDLTALVADENGNYREKAFPVRHNWMISLGPEVGYFLPDVRDGKGLSVNLNYRIQVQGIFVQSTVPIVAYAPLWIRVGLPL